MKLPSLEQIDAELARRSLREFIKQAWHVLEPNNVFVSNWHIDAICDHLEACSRGEITKLIINVPPGHMKSLLTCVFWCAWEWINKPHLKWLYASYAAHLSVRDSIKTRVLIGSDWYQRNFGKKYNLVKTNEQYITNDKTGFRIATSISGLGTGERVHRVVNDDLVNATDAQSEAMRQQAINHMQAMATRGVPSEPFIQVLIMQRLHEADPAGWAIEQGGWEQLILPAEFEPHRRAKTSIGFEDPRKEEGELLWPELFDHKKLAEIKSALGQYGTAAQLQQRPSPLDGGIIKLEWFNDKYYKTLPQVEYYIQSWDTAFKTGKENDYSVCTTWAVCKTGFYLVDRYKAKIEFPELKRMLITLANQYKPAAILIEDKASGQSLIQELKRDTRLPIKPIKIDTDKLSRVHAVTTTLEHNTYLPADAAWLRNYLDNLLVFPNGAHDDDVDSTSQALGFMVLNRPRAAYGANVNIMGR
jgi:predicted phage terminase large subunit-like protein